MFEKYLSEKIKYLNEKLKWFRKLELCEKFGFVLVLIMLIMFIIAWAACLNFIFALPSAISEKLGLDIDLGVMVFIGYSLYLGRIIYHDYVKFVSMLPLDRYDLWSQFAGDNILPYVENVSLRDIDPRDSRYRMGNFLGYDFSRIIMREGNERFVGKIVQQVKLNLLYECRRNHGIPDLPISRLKEIYRVEYHRPYILIEYSCNGIFQYLTGSKDSSQSFYNENSNNKP